MEMGDAIKELRIKNGLTQEELANQLGLQKSAIAKYENGRVENIKRSTIQKMSSLFGVPPSHILGMDEDNKDNKPEHYYYNEDARKLLQDYNNRSDLKVLFDASRNLTVKDVEFIIDMIERMKKE